MTGCNAKYEKNLIYDFLPTLRNVAKFYSKVIVWDWGLTKWARDELNKDVMVDLIPCPKESNFWINFNSRYRLIIETIDYLKDYELFMYCCAGDLWFQRPLDDLIDQFKVVKAIGHVKEIWQCSHSWFTNIANQLPDSRLIIETTCNEIMFNSGVMIGTRNDLRRFCQVLDPFVSRTNFFGPCQIYANYIAKLMERQLNFIWLNRTWNYMPQIFPYKVETIISLDETRGSSQDHILYNAETNQKVHIGHNAGQRLINRGI